MSTDLGLSMETLVHLHWSDNSFHLVGVNIALYVPYIALYVLYVNIALHGFSKDFLIEEN